MSDDEPGRCVHIKTDGERCAVHWGLIGGLCRAHDPGRREEFKAAQRKGGETSRRQQERQARAAGAFVDPDDAPPEPETLQDAVRWASWAARAVATGELDPRRADVVVRGLREFRQGLEKAQLEREVAELRATVAELRKGASR